MKKKKKTYMLSLEKDDPEKELEFEIKFQLSLTKKQRYNRMRKLVSQALEKKYDRKPTPSLFSRP